MKKDYPKAFENYPKALSVAPIGFKSENLFNNLSVTNLKSADFKTYFLTTLQDKTDTWLEYYQTTKQKEQYKYNTTLISLNEAKKYLSINQTVLEYFLGGQYEGSFH